MIEQEEILSDIYEIEKQLQWDQKQNDELIAAIDLASFLNEVKSLKQRKETIFRERGFKEDLSESLVENRDQIENWITGCIKSLEKVRYNYSC